MKWAVVVRRWAYRVIGVGLQGPRGSRGRPSRSQGVKGYAIRSQGRQGVGYRVPAGQWVGLQGPRGSFRGPRGSMAALPMHKPSRAA